MANAHAHSTSSAALLEKARMVEEFGREPAAGKRFVRNLMSQKVIEIDEDTPLCCNPASETYWSM